MEQEIEGPFKVLDANLIGQFGLFGGVEVVSTSRLIPALGERGASLIYSSGGREGGLQSPQQPNPIGNQQGTETPEGERMIAYCTGLISEPRGACPTADLVALVNSGPFRKRLLKNRLVSERRIGNNPPSIGTWPGESRVPVEQGKGKICLTVERCVGEIRQA